MSQHINNIVASIHFLPVDIFIISSVVGDLKFISILCSLETNGDNPALDSSNWEECDHIEELSSSLYEKFPETGQAFWVKTRYFSLFTSRSPGLVIGSVTAFGFRE